MSCSRPVGCCEGDPEGAAGPPGPHRRHLRRYRAGPPASVALVSQPPGLVRALPPALERRPRGWRCWWGGMAGVRGSFLPPRASVCAREDTVFPGFGWPRRKTISTPCRTSASTVSRNRPPETAALPCARPAAPSLGTCCQHGAPCHLVQRMVIVL